MAKVFAAVAVILAAALVITAHASSQERAIPGSTGSQRYLLFQGSFLTGDQKGTVDIRGVFKIDTQTGRTWLYGSGTGADGKLMHGWLPIEN